MGSRKREAYMLPRGANTEAIESENEVGEADKETEAASSPMKAGAL